MVKVFQQCNKGHVDFLMRIAWRLSNVFFKRSVVVLEENDPQKANNLILKANQYLQQSEEFRKNQGQTYKFMKKFRSGRRRKERAKLISDQTRRV